MADPVLTLERLSKSFSALAVTQAVSLDIRPGEIHALIGPNGAGKTTLVAQVAGALKPDSGVISFAGRDVTALGVAARARLGLSRVFQISNVVGGFTALENVMVAIIAAGDGPFRMGRRALADAGLREQAHAALDAVGLAGRALVAAAQLAHGERRALELAMSLAQHPRLLLLDEPMAGTGKAEGERLAGLLLALKGRIPMLLIEHDMDTVFRLADRVSVLISGALAMTGAPEAVRRDPLVRAAYLGEDEAV